jgi:dihydroflavonol-4-reductase
VLALVLRAVARAGDLLSRITRRPPSVTPELAVILTGQLVFSSARATAELDYRSTALAEMYGDAKTWLETRGV